MAEQDTLSIINTINLYGLAMDTQRWDLFDRIYMPDCDVDFGDPSHWTNLKQFKSDFEAFHTPFDATQHVMSNHVVTVSGDTANAFCYGYWRLLRKNVDGGDFWEGSGWYDDELVRAKSSWLIKRRTCRVTWWAGNPIVQEVFPEVKFSMRTTSPRAEERAGRIAFVKALGK
jgi:SnoaL-like domain